LEPWVENLPLERLGPVKRAVKAIFINPLANYLPAAVVKSILKFTESELAASNWKDPGGWRSMVISYENKPRKIADKVLVGSGTMPMALRNRRMLAAAIMAGIIDRCPTEPVYVLCLGAGPGHIITDAIAQARKPVQATLVDLSSDAFEYGRQLAQRHGLSDRMRFIQGDVRNVREMLGRQRVDLVKMLGICEYLTDEQIVDIIQTVAAVMPPGSAIVANSISRRHGTDRFFRRVFGLHMTYRSPAQLEALLSRGGLGEFTVTAEPLGVYHILVGRKT
jgi:SAM-dependent methyltransferase